MTADADALYRAALNACEQGRIADGIALARSAIVDDAQHAQAHRLLGMALLRVGDAAAALPCFERAIALGVSSAALHGACGDALAALQRPLDALASYDHAVKDGGSADDWCNRGVLLHELGRHADATESFDRALALDPDFTPAYYNRGIALAAQGRHDDAVAAFDAAILRAPATAPAYNNRALSLDQRGRGAEALASAEQALAIDPQYRDAMVTLGILRRKMRRPEEALEPVERALALQPDDVDALLVKGDALIDLERFDDAIQVFDRIMQLDPAATAAPWNKSLICLGLGRFDAGWPLYGHRWKAQRSLIPRLYPQRPWDSGRLDGPLLVWGEQGLGDEILHASMMADVTARTGEVLFECEPRLAPLFARSFPQVTIVPVQDALYGGPVSAQIALGDLGALFRKDWQAFPRRGRGYLVPDETRRQQLRARLAGTGSRVVGLSWISKAPTGGAQKSASLKDLMPLLRLPGLRFVDLQYGDTQAERDALARETGIAVERLPDIDTMNDIDGLAALIAACDVVVTVSNTTAHLAGALGAETWVMVPNGQARIWYWFKDKPDSPWYPFARVRRQRRGQSWSDVAAGVAGEVASLPLVRRTTPD